MPDSESAKAHIRGIQPTCSSTDSHCQSTSKCSPSKLCDRSFWLQTDATVPDDKAYFRELEAIYLLRLLLISCSSSLESCAYELQDASAVLTSKLQSTLLLWLASNEQAQANLANLCNAEPFLSCGDPCPALCITVALTHYHACPIQDRELSSCRWRV